MRWKIENTEKWSSCWIRGKKSFFGHILHLIKSSDKPFFSFLSGGAASLKLLKYYIKQPWNIIVMQETIPRSRSMSSQPITSRIYQRLIYLLTYQIIHQGFWIFNWLTLPLDSEDGFRTGCLNLSH